MVDEGSTFLQDTTASKILINIYKHLHQDMQTDTYAQAKGKADVRVDLMRLHHHHIFYASVSSRGAVCSCSKGIPTTIYYLRAAGMRVEQLKPARKGTSIFGLFCRRVFFTASFFAVY